LVGFAEHKAELDKLGVSVVAASVDPEDKAKEVADEVNFPVGFEVSRDIADALGSWWEDRRSIIQPSEFILDENNNVVASSYADGPLGRLEAGDVVKLVTFYESRK
jgi:peroxiredoxin